MRHTLIAGLALLFIGAPAVGDVRIKLRNGTEIKGTLASSSVDGELTIRTTQGERLVLLENVDSIQMSQKAESNKDAGPHQLLLQDGTRLLVLLQEVKARARVKWRDIQFEIQPAGLRVLGLAKGAWHQFGRHKSAYLDLGPKKDQVFPFSTFGVEGGKIITDGKSFALDKVRAIHFPVAAHKDKAALGWYVRAMPSTDQLVVGLLERIDEKSVYIRTRFMGRVQLPRSQVWKLVFGPPPDATNMGFTLVAASHGKHVVLLDPSGQPLWRIPDLRKPHDVEPLPDGTFLVAEYQGGRVARVDRTGKTLWEIKGLRQPIDIDLVPGGNYLVTEFQGNRILEFDKKGKQVWALEGLKYPNEAEPVGKDRVLICESGRQRVILVDKKTKKVLWEFTHGFGPDGKKTLKWPMDADWLGNGNVLITDNNAKQVFEVTAAGKIVWSYNADNPYEADKLGNGNYLIVETGLSRVIEITPDKRIVWQSKELDYPVAATRY